MKTIAILLTTLFLVGCGASQLREYQQQHEKAQSKAQQQEIRQSHINASDRLDRHVN